MTYYLSFIYMIKYNVNCEPIPIAAMKRLWGFFLSSCLMVQVCTSSMWSTVRSLMGCRYWKWLSNRFRCALCTFPRSISHPRCWTKGILTPLCLTSFLLVHGLCEGFIWLARATIETFNQFFCNCSRDTIKLDQSNWVKLGPSAPRPSETFLNIS